MNKKHGPWIITASRIVYQNPWLSVREDKVVRPDKKPGMFGVVTQKGGISVLPVDDDGTVYLTREFRYAVGRRSIEAISGGREKGHSFLQTAKKELKEEAGLLAKKWSDLGPLDPLTSVLLNPGRLFLAQNLTQTKAAPEGTEQIEILKMPFEQALDLAMKNKITHAPTLVLILKAREFIQH